MPKEAGKAFAEVPYEQILRLWTSLSGSQRLPTHSAITVTFPAAAWECLTIPLSFDSLSGT
jgi:hypothetical protein